MNIRGGMTLTPMGIKFPLSVGTLPKCSQNEAIAYQDAAMTVVDSGDPLIGSDANGCYAGYIKVNEQGFAGSFSDVVLPLASCGAIVRPLWQIRTRLLAGWTSRLGIQVELATLTFRIVASVPAEANGYRCCG